MKRNQTTHIITLIGMPGSGKSVLGRRLSGVFPAIRPFYFDLDKHITQKTSTSPKSWIKKYGIEVFRETEFKVLNNIVETMKEKPFLLLILGGGTLTHEASFRLLFNAYHIFLHIPFDALKKQIEKSKNKRPLLNQISLDELYKTRVPFYEALAQYHLINDETSDLNTLTHDLKRHLFNYFKKHQIYL